MPEIVVNRCPRGTLFSEAGKAEFLKRKGLSDLDWSTLDRSDADLVAMMKEDEGKRVWAGQCSRVEILTVPDGIVWKIKSDKGREWITAGGFNG